MKKTTKIFGLLLTLFGLALVTGCTPITDTPDVPEETTYTVTIASGITYGTVKADKNSAKAGETVKLTATPDSGYELDTFYVNDNAITGSTFTMPASNVTVDATFTKTAETLNQEAADAVIAKINAIGTVEYTDASKAKIDDARTAYNALTEAQKALVSAETLAILTTAESTYTSLISSTPTETETDNGESDEREYTVSYLFDHNGDNESDLSVVTSDIDLVILGTDGALHGPITRTADEWKQFFSSIIEKIYLNFDGEESTTYFEIPDEDEDGAYLEYTLDRVEISNETELKLIFK